MKGNICNINSCIIKAVYTGCVFESSGKGSCVYEYKRFNAMPYIIAFREPYFYVNNSITCHVIPLSVFARGDDHNLQILFVYIPAPQRSFVPNKQNAL